MTASAKMDAAVAERVMGWIQDDSPVWLDEKSSVMRRVAEWRPTTDPRDSRMVVERMLELDFKVSIQYGLFGSGWRVGFYTACHHTLAPPSDSLDRAICEAALEALSNGDG